MLIKGTKGSNGKVRRRAIVTQGAFGSSTTKKPVTGLNEGSYTFADHAFATETAKLIKKGKRLHSVEKSKVYYDQTKKFQLWRGETKFAAPKEMTRREAWALNKQLEHKFLNDKSEKARLWRWMEEGQVPMPKGTTLDQYRQSRIHKPRIPKT